MSLEKSFLKICLSFCIYLSAILALAIFGHFNKLSITIVTAFLSAAVIYILARALIAFKWKELSKIKICCFLVIALFSLFIGFFHHDLPTGRDEFSYIYAADRLVASGSLAWEDYFTRPMHGVRNLGGNIFTSQFLPAYTSYLAVYEVFGGLEALLWANVLLVLFAFGTIYYLVKNLAGEKASLLAIIFLLSSYVFFWFPKRTNVENISIFVIWLGIWLAVKSFKDNKPIYLIGGLIPFSLLALTRPEGLIFFAGYLLVTAALLIFKFKRRFFDGLLINVSIAILSLINLVLFYSYIQFYEARYIYNQLFDVFEGFDYIYSRPLLAVIPLALFFAAIMIVIKLRRKLNFQKLLFWLITLTVLAYEALFFIKVEQGNLTWEVYRSQYVLENFTFYLYFVYVFIILIGLRKKLFTSLELLITIILLPAFFFIIEPNIALDQPWFMRRFFPNLIPLLIILSAIILTRLNLTKKQLRYIIISAILIGAITSRSVMFFVEHKGLKEQVEEFNKLFPKDALIIMNPGWSWQKIAIIQHYFYDYDALPNIDLYVPEEFEKDLPAVISQHPNWETDNADLIAIINWEKNKSEEYFVELIKKYPQVYVATTEKNSNFFTGYRDQNIELVDNYTFTYDELRKESNLTQYIQQNKIIDISKVRTLQNFLPPNTIVKQTIELNVFRVINSLEYIPTQYVLSADEMREENRVYFALKDVDLNNYRKELRNLVRSVETEND